MARVREPEPDQPHEIPKGRWKAILRRSFSEFKHDDVSDRAAALTFFGVLAIFPGALVVVSLLGMLGEDTTQKLLDNLGEVAPEGVQSFLGTVIEQVQGKGGVAGLTAIIGLLIALWSASGYVAAFMRASNAIYDVDEGRPIWRTVPTRVLTTIALVILLVLSAIIVVVTGPIARQVGEAIALGDAAVTFWDIAKWPVLLVLASFMISLLYWAAPNVKQGFPWITPGGVLAVLVWLVASGLFGLYVAFSGSYNKTYGTLAGVIIFLVWLWISNIAILFGAEVNAELQRQREIERGLPAEVEPYLELRDTRKLSNREKQRVKAAAEQRQKYVDR